MVEKRINKLKRVQGDSWKYHERSLGYIDKNETQKERSAEGDVYFADCSAIHAVPFIKPSHMD